MDGDAVELEQAYRECGPSVWAYLRARVGDSHDAEELLQETFLAAARDLPALRRAHSQRAWLIGIAHNLVRVYRRRARRIPNDEIDLRLIALPKLNQDERLDALRQRINGLQEGLREVLELRLREELSYAEIAEALGIPIGTVRSRLHLAVRSLKVNLNNDAGAAAASHEQRGRIRRDPTCGDVS